MTLITCQSTPLARAWAGSFTKTGTPLQSIVPVFRFRAPPIGSDGRMSSGQARFFFLLVSWLATSANKPWLSLSSQRWDQGSVDVFGCICADTWVQGICHNQTILHQHPPPHKLSNRRVSRNAFATSQFYSGAPETAKVHGTLKIMKCNKMVHGKVQVLFFFRNWSSKSSSKILRVHDFFYAIYFLVAVCLGHGRNTGRPEFRRLYHGTVTLRPHTRSQLVWYDSMTLRYLKQNVGAHKILRDKEHQRLPVLDVLRKSCSLQICFSTSQTCRCRS